jgi:hypothetical protein
MISFEPPFEWCLSGAWNPLKSRFSRLVSVAAAPAAFAALLTAYHFGHFRLTNGSQDAYIALVSTRVGALMSIGLKDHIHCSVFRKYPRKLPTTEEILHPTREEGVKAISPQYAGLIPIVRSLVPETYRLTLAHQCTYKGREFIHLSLMDNSNMLSLVITRKVNRESFRAEDMLPALSESGIPMYQVGVHRFDISAFATSDYLVYFISDLDKQHNTQLMLALAPQVQGFFARLELRLSSCLQFRFFMSKPVVVVIPRSAR